MRTIMVTEKLARSNANTSLIKFNNQISLLQCKTAARRDRSRASSSGCTVTWAGAVAKQICHIKIITIFLNKRSDSQDKVTVGGFKCKTFGYQMLFKFCRITPTQSKADTLKAQAGTCICHVVLTLCQQNCYFFQQDVDNHNHNTLKCRRNPCKVSCPCQPPSQDQQSDDQRNIQRN